MVWVLLLFEVFKLQHTVEVRIEDVAVNIMVLVFDGLFEPAILANSTFIYFQEFRRYCMTDKKMILH